MSNIKQWVGECMRKKKLRERWANRIIEKAAQEGHKLYKYYCNHCQWWHVTKQAKHDRRPTG